MSKKIFPFHYFTAGEQLLWALSVGAILLSFFLFGGEDYLTLAASVLGVTSLIFCAKGNPFGQVLMIVFSVLYGLISLGFSYYGEMVTYLGMTAPMAVVALVSWMKHPFQGNRSEVTVNRIDRRECARMTVLTCAVTAAFYLILRAFGTANLLPSTLSVTTSFLAAYLTFRRSAYFALAYAANDVVLLVLWSMAAAQERTYCSVVVCFAAFLANDLYGYFSWRKMYLRQTACPPDSAQPLSE